MTNYYTILGIPNFASLEQIKDAYKRKIKLYHPDISNEPNAEEMTKILNLIKAQLDTPDAKLSYDRKLKRAYDIERGNYRPLKTNRTRRTNRGRKVLTREEIKELKKRSALAKKKAIKNKYEKSLRLFPKPARTVGVLLIILLGFQLIHTHFFFYYGSLDRILFTLGIGVLFVGFSMGANELYTRMIIKSVSQPIGYSFEKRIAWFFVAGYISTILFIFVFNNKRADYLLANNYNYVTARIMGKMSSYGRIVVWYEVDDKQYYKALDAHLYELPKIAKGYVMLKYANSNPLICEAVDIKELDTHPAKTIIYEE